MAKKLSIFIDQTGTMRTIEPDMAELMQLRQTGRFSHIEPANKHIRRVFQRLRAHESDNSWVAAWTRRWPVLWQVRIAHSNKILGTFWNRKQAVDVEKAYFASGNWIPSYFAGRDQGDLVPRRERAQGPSQD